MSLLTITGLSHSYGDHVLYRNAEFTLNKGEHIGIVGQNGTGKSTLIKICTEQVIPDQGRIVRQPGITVGYLDQYAKLEEYLTVKEFLRSAFSHLYKTEEKMNRLYEGAAKGEDGMLVRAARYQEYLEQCDFYSVETRIRQVASGLGLTGMGLDRLVSHMSGGQRAKVILAKLILERPDVLLLDEPTNFLDQEQVTWLGEYLTGIENAFLLVSHDDHFLEVTSNRICDIDNDTITKYHGTYSEFVQKKTRLRDDYQRQYAAQQKEIKKTEEFIRKNIAGRNARMARGRQKQLDRLERMDALENREIKPAFPFVCLPFTDTEHLTVGHLTVGYQEPVLEDISFSVKGGQKAVITGFNGVGKSTLLKTIMGQIPALGGRVRLSAQVTAAYFEQELVWTDQTMTPLQVISDLFPDMTVREVRQHLAYCGISAKQALQPIGTLSGGEQTKVKLCILTLIPCNLMIMDEPTNHLDIQAKDALKKSLSQFPGTVLLVSHEESFYRGWAQRVIEIS
jgi:ATPase subunit of ABC transporter with duplicated ATPase domains